MRVIIAGSRTIMDYDIGLAVVRSGFEITEIVSGKNKWWHKELKRYGGIDYLAELWAETQNIPVKPFPADWTSYGPSAGPIRNKEMAVYADALIAIHKGNSRGTQSMIFVARQKGLKVYVEVL